MNMLAPYRTAGLLGGLAGIFFLGSWTGWTFKAANASKDVIRVQEQMRQTAENASLIIAARTNERDQCRAEVEKVNATNKALSDKIAANLRADQKRRDAALQRIEDVTNSAAEKVEIIKIRTEEARAIIETVQDACVGAGVPTDVTGLLNNIVKPSAVDGGGD